MYSTITIIFFDKKKKTYLCTILNLSIHCKSNHLHYGKLMSGFLYTTIAFYRMSCLIKETIEKYLICILLFAYITDEDCSSNVTMLWKTPNINKTI